MVAEVEDLHGIEVEVVTVGDTPLTTASMACCSAAREATVNAAKHSGVDTVSLYVEAEPDQLTVFVRDRGTGFDPDDCPTIGAASRRRSEIAWTRHGGTARSRRRPERAPKSCWS